MGNAAYCTWVYWGINKEGRCGANEVMEGEIKSSGVVYQYCTRTKGVEKSLEKVAHRISVWVAAKNSPDFPLPPRMVFIRGMEDRDY